MAQKDTAAGVTEEKTAEKAAAPKFPAEKLSAHCRQLFGVSSCTFAGATQGMTGETLRTYSMDYAWYIMFFHHTAQEAYALGLSVLTAIKGSRNLIPLITETGEPAGGKLRIDDPSLKILDDGAAQLTQIGRAHV